MNGRTRKLSAEDRQDLITFWKLGMSQRALAAKYGVTEASISYHIRRYTGATPGQTTAAIRKFDVESHRQALNQLLRIVGVTVKSIVEIERGLTHTLVQMDYAESTGERVLGAGHDPFTDEAVTWTAAEEHEIERLAGRMRAYPQETLELSPAEYPSELAELFERAQVLESKRQIAMPMN